MTNKTLQPAASGKGKRAERSDLAVQQIRSFCSKASSVQKEISITSYLVDGRLNVIEIQFGVHHEH